ncbi:MAG: hypothetical protein ABJK59_13190 [Erythrobacter sp.]|uniref:hypothetical protein n=1 Tax=Erythrobacter sp. TaxID=1042 RepID=UPI0032981DD0
MVIILLGSCVGTLADALLDYHDFIDDKARADSPYILPRGKAIAEPPCKVNTRARTLTQRLENCCHLEIIYQQQQAKLCEPP